MSPRPAAFLLTFASLLLACDSPLAADEPPAFELIVLEGRDAETLRGGAIGDSGLVCVRTRDNLILLWRPGSEATPIDPTALQRSNYEPAAIGPNDTVALTARPFMVDGQSCLGFLVKPDRTMAFAPLRSPPPSGDTAFARLYGVRFDGNGRVLATASNGRGGSTQRAIAYSPGGGLRPVDRSLPKDATDELAGLLDGDPILTRRSRAGVSIVRVAGEVGKPLDVAVPDQPNAEIKYAAGAGGGFVIVQVFIPGNNRTTLMRWSPDGTADLWENHPDRVLGVADDGSVIATSSLSSPRLWLTDGSQHTLSNLVDGDVRVHSGLATNARGDVLTVIKHPDGERYAVFRRK